MKHLDLIPLLTIALEKMLRLDAIRQPFTAIFASQIGIGLLSYCL